MKIGYEIETETGVATYISDYGMFAAFIHVSQIPEEITTWNMFDANPEIFLSSIDDREDFLVRVSLNLIVENNCKDGFTTEGGGEIFLSENGVVFLESGEVFLSRDDCLDIDCKAWSVLGKKYLTAPTVWVDPMRNRR